MEFQDSQGYGKNGDWKSSFVGIIPKVFILRVGFLDSHVTLHGPLQQSKHSSHWIVLQIFLVRDTTLLGGLCSGTLFET